MASDLEAASNSLPLTAAPAHRIARQRKQTSGSTTSYRTHPKHSTMATKQKATGKNTEAEHRQEVTAGGHHFTEYFLCTRCCRGPATRLRRELSQLRNKGAEPRCRTPMPKPYPLCQSLSHRHSSSTALQARWDAQQVSKNDSGLQSSQGRTICFAH